MITDDGGSLIPDGFMRQMRLSMFGQKEQREGKVFVYESEFHSVPADVYAPTLSGNSTWMTVSREVLEDSGWGPRRAMWHQREQAAIRRHWDYRGRLTEAVHNTIWKARKAVAHRIYPFTETDDD